ncbi:hypothetical protein CRUP_029890 [Coryphaenoides rupestris]|nr:hypothetical protein CRUP_029890 [Coryphaenoides rupestris]
METKEMMMSPIKKMERGSEKAEEEKDRRNLDEEDKKMEEEEEAEEGSQQENGRLMRAEKGAKTPGFTPGQRVSNGLSSAAAPQSPSETTGAGYGGTASGPGGGGGAAPATGAGTTTTTAVPVGGLRTLVVQQMSLERPRETWSKKMDFLLSVIGYAAT